MQKYFISTEELINNVITSDDAFHITNVLRMKENDNIIVSDNINTYLVSIKSLSKNKIVFEKLNQIFFKPKKYNITLIQSLPKTHKLEYILQKNTELNIDEIILVESQRSITKIKKDKLDNKISRYTKIIKEASEQSLKQYLTRLQISTLSNIDYSLYDLKILCYENEKNIKLHNITSEIKNYNNIVFFVGPEGGVTNDEYEFLTNKGFISVSLGENILRTETASLYILSVIKYEMEKGS